MFCILRIFYWPLKDISIQESTFWSKYYNIFLSTRFSCAAFPLCSSMSKLKNYGGGR